MGRYHNFNTHAQFHESYLKELLKEKKTRYSKTNPGDVLKEYYLKQLLTRIESETSHLPSFQKFIQFCKMIKTKLN